MRKAIAILVFCVACLWADVPNEITYQGRLREYGQPVNGTRTMRFSVYDAATNGTQRWTSGDVSVTVSSGAFSCTLSPNTIDWRGKDFWIETIISGKVLSPREKITAQAFALHSQTAESLTKSSGDIKFEVGATSYVVVNSGGLRLNSGSITFPDNTSLTTASIGAASSVANNGDALIIGDADSNGAGDVKVRIGATEKFTVPNAGEVKSLLNGSTYYMVPRGGIIMWSGAVSDIPPGWGLCDGKWYSPGDLSSGQLGQAVSDPGHYIQTPNLSGRFIVGYNSSDSDYAAIADTGGEKTHVLSLQELPAHDHGGVTGDQDRSHSHSYSKRDGYYSAGGSGGTQYWGNETSATSGSASQGHTHAIGSSGSGLAHENRPPYFVLAFIMKL